MTFFKKIILSIAFTGIFSPYLVASTCNCNDCDKEEITIQGFRHPYVKHTNINIQNISIGIRLGHVKNLMREFKSLKHTFKKGYFKEIDDDIKMIGLGMELGDEWGYSRCDIQDFGKYIVKEGSELELLKYYRAYKNINCFLSRYKNKNITKNYQVLMAEEFVKDLKKYKDKCNKEKVKKRDEKNIEEDYRGGKFPITLEVIGSCKSNTFSLVTIKHAQTQLYYSSKISDLEDYFKIENNKRTLLQACKDTKVELVDKADKLNFYKKNSLGSMSLSSKYSFKDNGVVVDKNPPKIHEEGFATIYIEVKNLNKPDQDTKTDPRKKNSKHKSINSGKILIGFIAVALAIGGFLFISKKKSQRKKQTI